MAKRLKPKTKDVLLDDLLREIGRLERKNPEGWTIQEMSDHTGLSTNLCRDRMRRLINAGKAFCNGRKMVMAIDGTERYAPVYCTKRANDTQGISYNQ